MTDAAPNYRKETAWKLAELLEELYWRAYHNTPFKHEETFDDEPFAISVREIEEFAALEGRVHQLMNDLGMSKPHAWEGGFGYCGAHLGEKRNLEGRAGYLMYFAPGWFFATFSLLAAVYQILEEPFPWVLPADETSEEGSLVLSSNGQFYTRGEPLRLSNLPSKILCRLFERSPQFVSASELLQLWPDKDGSRESLRTNIHSLRQRFQQVFGDRGRDLILAEGRSGDLKYKFDKELLFKFDSDLTES